MDSLALKLVLTPALIGAASLAGRRWGPALSGWLVGLPFTSAPIALFLALDHGVTFARAAAIGTLAGTMSQAAFCLAYGALAPRFDWRITLPVSVFAFAAVTAALQFLAVPLFALLAIVTLVLIAALAGTPQRADVASSRRLPAWDIPARMILATVFVLALTGVASMLGARLTGLLAPFPLYAAVLATFAHRLQGAGAARGVVHGLLLGLFAFAGFFVTLAALIADIGIVLAFVAATLVALALQGASFVMLQRRNPA